MPGITPCKGHFCPGNGRGNAEKQTSRESWTRFFLTKKVGKSGKRKKKDINNRNESQRRNLISHIFIEIEILKQCKA